SPDDLLCFFVFVDRPGVRSPLFPYTTLFRSGAVGRGVLVGGVLTVLTLIPFAVGYHFWAGLAWERDAHFAWDNYRRWPLEVEGKSEEHTSELQSRENLVCRLLLEKKNR